MKIFCASCGLDVSTVTANSSLSGAIRISSSELAQSICTSGMHAVRSRLIPKARKIDLCLITTTTTQFFLRQFQAGSSHHLLCPEW